MTNTQEINQFLIDNKALIFKIATDFYTKYDTHFEYLDICQECFCDSIRIMRRFNPHKHTKPTSFLCKCLLPDMATYIYRHSRYMDYPYWVGNYRNKYKADRENFRKKYSKKLNLKTETFDSLDNIIDLYANNKSYNEKVSSTADTELVDILPSNTPDKFENELNNKITIERFSKFIQRWDEETQYILNHLYGLNGCEVLLQREIADNRHITMVTIRKRAAKIIQHFQRKI